MIAQVFRTRALGTGLLALLLAPAAPLVAAAQTPTATTAVITGTVVDSSGAVLPGAAVVLTDRSTNPPTGRSRPCRTRRDSTRSAACSLAATT
jgi:hypothetical protein